MGKVLPPVVHSYPSGLSHSMEKVICSFRRFNANLNLDLDPDPEITSCRHALDPLQQMADECL